LSFLWHTAINLNDLKCQSLPAGSYRSILHTKCTHQLTNLFPHCLLERLHDLQILLQRVCGLIFYTYTKNTAATKIIMKNLYENSLKCQLHAGKQFMNKWKGFQQQVLLYTVRELAEETYVLNKEHLMKSGLGWRHLQENLYPNMYIEQTCLPH